MSLTPLPANNTKRYFLGNIASSKQHHIQIRTSDTASDSAMVTVLTDAFSNLLPVMFNDCSFNELLVAEHGSDIRNPVSGWSTLVGTAGVPQPDQDIPLSLCARGRSPTGRKVRLFLWGMFFTRDTDWVLQPSEGSEFGIFIAFLNAASNVYLAIDGTQPIWRGDYTIQFNDHWVQDARPA